jgi:hypothetical protein
MPGEKIGFSTFCKLRPLECVLAGPKGTHSVCVCIIHQNTKLMFNAIKDKGFRYSSTEECLQFLMCIDPSKECFFNTCELCPTIENESRIEAN